MPNGLIRLTIICCLVGCGGALRADKTLTTEYDTFRRRMMTMPEETLADFADDQRKAEIDRLTERVAEAEAIQRTSSNGTERFDSQLSGLSEAVDHLKAAIAAIIDTEPLLVRELIASMVETIELDVRDRGKNRSPRFEPVGGEITLKAGFSVVSNLNDVS